MQTGTRKSWLHAAGLLATTLLMVTLVGLVLRGSWQEHRGAQLERVAVLSRAFTSHVGAVIKSVSDDLRQVAGEIAGDPTLLDPADPRLTRRLALLRSTRDSGVRYIVGDAEGAPMLGDATPGDRNQIDALIALHAAGSPGDLQVSPSVGRDFAAGARFALSAAIRRADGRMLGLVAAQIPSADLTAVFRDLNLLAGNRMSLLRVGGVLLARMPAIDTAVGAPIGRSKIGELILQGAREGSTVEMSPFDGATIVSHFAVIDDAPVIPVVTVPEAEIWSSWVRGNLGPLGASTLLLAALLGVHAVLLVRLRARGRAEHKLHEAAVRAAEAAQQGIAVTDARLRDAIESISEGFLLWDADDRLLLWNRRFVTLTGIGGDVERILRPGMKFEDAIRALGRRTMPGASAGDLDGWMIERLQRRAQVGVPWSFTAINGRRLELEERRTSEGGLVSICRDVGDHVEAVERVAEAEARFRDGVESMDDGFLLLDRDDRVVTWNRSYLAMLPYMDGIIRAGAAWTEMLDLALGRGLPELDAATRARWIADRLAARERGEVVEFETRLGHILQAVDRPTSEGGYVVILRDVTEEKRLLRQVSESEARFRDGIESMAEGMVMWDAQDRMVLWNQRARDMFGFVSEHWQVGDDFEHAMRRVSAILMPHATPAERERWVSARKEAHANGSSVEYTTPAGRTIEVRDRGMSDGGTITIYRDVSEERRLMRRLAESEARFWDGIDSMGEGFLLCDPQDRIFAWNHQAVTLSPEMQDVVAVGKPFTQFLRELLRVMHPELDADALDERLRERVAWREQLGVARDMRWPSGRVLRTVENRTSEGGIVSVWHDVTAQLRAQAELERALCAEREMNAQQRRFVSIVSHEFRTPLAVIDGATQRLIAKLADVDAESRKRLARIRGAVSRMTQLIERTLSSARLDDGRIEIEPRMFDLAGLLREVGDRQRQISPIFEIALDTGDGELPIMGDVKLLEQVFTNLLSNAVKYSGRARRIEVLAGLADGMVSVAVRDHGVGIPAEDLPQLFTRFFRARTSIGIPGTGIGLHLVRELVQMHGGRVDVVSELGRGSTFTVTLPRRQQITAPTRNAAE